MTPTKLGKSVPNRLVMICGEATSPAVQASGAHPPPCLLRFSSTKNACRADCTARFAHICGSLGTLPCCLLICNPRAGSSPAPRHAHHVSFLRLPASPGLQASLNMLAGNGVSTPPLIGVGSTAQQVLDVKTAVQVCVRL